jgi:hypothetical protein
MVNPQVGGAVTPIDCLREVREATADELAAVLCLPREAVVFALRAAKHERMAVLDVQINLLRPPVEMWRWVG